MEKKQVPRSFNKPVVPHEHGGGGTVFTSEGWDITGDDSGRFGT